MEHAPERANFILPWRCPEAELPWAFLKSCSSEAPS